MRPVDLGQQIIGYDDPHPWVLPIIGGVAMAAFLLMLILGKAPWQ